MNVLTFVTRCLFASFVLKSVCCTKKLAEALSSTPGGIVQADTPFKDSTGNTSITFKSGFDEPLKEKGTISYLMLLDLMLNAGKDNASNVYDVEISTFKDKRPQTGWTHLRGVFHSLETSYRVNNIETLLQYVDDNDLQLVVNATDANKTVTSFLVEGRKLTPVPDYLLPGYQEPSVSDGTGSGNMSKPPVSSGNMISSTVIVVILIVTAVIVALIYGYIKYKDTANEEEL